MATKKSTPVVSNAFTSKPDISAWTKKQRINHGLKQNGTKAAETFCKNHKYVISPSKGIQL